MKRIFLLGIGLLLLAVFLAAAYNPSSLTPLLIRNQDATVSNFKSVIITTTSGPTPISATAISGNFSTHIAAYVNDTGTNFNSAIVLVGTSGLTATGGGVQILPDNAIGVNWPMPGDKTYVISSTTGQKIRADLPIR